jgi:hypothetical protein
MNKLKKIGLVGILTGSLLFSGCVGKNRIEEINLPNGYTTQGSTRPSQKYLGSTNIFSEEEDLANKSRTNGEIIEAELLNGTYILKFKNDTKEYLLEVKNKDNLSSSIISKLFNKGDKISIPTIREYDFIDNVTTNGYRTLKDVDYIYLGEIKTND